MGLALAWRYVNMGDQLDPTGKMPVSPTGKMTVPRRARGSRALPFVSICFTTWSSKRDDEERTT
ncbi:MAG: hypothetical protein DME69_12920 [Verrucomicrobia bacterium]|nr:MAG: hypothetical protein DME69_12920 [Verrucomicrobiota bacterium]